MTAIEWTDETWNPVRGCSLVSPGCTNCYAMREAARWPKHYAGLTKWVKGLPVWTGDVRLVPEKLDAPLRWRKPRRVFVNSMSDLFHESVPDEFIDRVFWTMRFAAAHTFQVLTKRPERMARYRPSWAAASLGLGDLWPLPNVWLGVSVEDQARADERIPLLLETPAAVRFLSVEPLLGPVDLNAMSRTPGAGYDEITDDDDALGPPLGGADGIDWVIVGGESGPGARPCDVAWIRSVVKQCHDAQVPCFVKQLGARPSFDPTPGLGNMSEFIAGGRYRVGGGGERPFLTLTDRKGGDPEEWPLDLRVREFPKTYGGDT